MIRDAAADRRLRPFDNLGMMITRSHLINTLFSAVLFVGMAIAWIIFAPIQFGGQVAYVIVNGNSMQPLYLQGDLVIVHRAAEYQVGDIVTYHHPDIGPVIHRIIGQQADQYILKGDHNTWTDSFLPKKTDIIGKAWIHLPSVGKVFGFLRIPWVLSIFVGAIGAVFLFTIIPSPDEKRPQHGRRARKDQRPPMKTILEKRDDWLFVLAALAIAALALAVAAFTHPITRTLMKDIQYQQKGQFSYSAPHSDKLSIYAPAGLQTGEPVFHQLIHSFNVQFDYQILSDTPITSQGTVRLIAELNAMDGWHQILELQPSIPFTGSKVSVSGIVNLDAIQATLDDLQLQTGVQRQDYTVLIVPQISINGTIGSQAISENFAPQLQFQVDPLEMQMIRPDPSGPNPIFPATNELLKSPYSEPNTLSILGLKLQVLSARWISIIVLVLALGALASLVVLIYRQMQAEGEPARIQRKYASLLVNVSKGPPARDANVRDVETMEDLTRLAEKANLPILHAVKGLDNIYFLQDSEITYRYTITEEDSEKTS
jgi:signal peptidase I